MQALICVRDGEKLMAQRKAVEGKKMFLNAAALFEKADGRGLDAAECYFKGGDIEPAVKLFMLYRQHFKALSICLGSKSLELGLETLSAIPRNADPVLIDKYARFFALASRRKSQLSRMSQFLSFVEPSSCRSFLKRYKENDELYIFDQKLGN